MNHLISSRLIGSGLATGLALSLLSGCEYTPPLDFKIPPPFSPNYQTVSMLSSVGQAPRMEAAKGKTRVDFGQGPGGLVFQFDAATVQRRFGVGGEAFATQAMADCKTADCLANDPEYKELLKSKQLSQFKLATGVLQVGETKLDIKVNALTLANDLSYALELVGLAENTRIILNGSAFDKEGKVIGQLNYSQFISQKVDTVTLDRLLGEIQAQVKP